MKVDFSQRIKGIDGKAVTSQGKKLTLSSLSVSLLLDTNDTKVEADDKLKRFKLALRVQDAKKIEITPEEASLIRNISGKISTPLAHGRIVELLS